jgi:hypothetical protein
MAQELKPIDNSFFGGRRSWRDEARLRLQQALGETGERLGEGLLGESEEEKYLEFLQRTYGSELPRDEEGNIDVPLSRPISDALRNMSDIGAADKILMILSGGGSIMPKAASIAAGTETAALLGDAAGEFRKDNPLGGGIMTAAAALPFGVNRLVKEGSRNRTKNTPLLPDQNRRQFVKGLGVGIAGLGVMASPLGTLMRTTGKVMEKINPTKFLNKLTEIDPRLPKITDNSISKIGFNQSYQTPNTTKVLDDNWNDLATPLWNKLGRDKDELLAYASQETELLSKFGKEHFSKYGLTPDDINEVFGESLSYEEAIKGLYKGDKYVGDDLYELEKIIWNDPKAIRIETPGTDTPGKPWTYAQKGVMTTIDDIPVAVARHEYENVLYIPNEQGLAKLAK